MNFTENSNGPILPQTNKIPIHQSWRRCDRSAQHSRAVVRHVEGLGGPARNLCRDCWCHICASEARAVLVAAWNNLWNVRPWSIWTGGALAEACADVCTGGVAPIGRGGRTTA